MNDPHSTPPPFGNQPPPPDPWAAPPAGEAPAPPTQWGAPPTPAPPVPGQSAPAQWGAPPPQYPTAPPAPPAPGQWGAPAPPGGQYPPGQYPPGQYPGGQMPAQPYIPGGWTNYQQQLGARIAEPGIRIGAKVIDVIFVMILQVILGVIAGIAVGAAAFSSGSGDPFASGGNPFLGANLTLTLVVGAFTLAIDFVYNVVIVARFGGQPGKLMLGLRIVDTDGARPSMGVAFRRWTPMLVIVVLGIIPVISLLGGLARIVLMIANLVMIFADDRRRDVFDHVGGTFVVTTR